MKNFDYEFWLADRYGLVRQRQTSDETFDPEIWRDGGWRTGSPYVVDAITGMGEDPYSCGEFADRLTKDEASAFAQKMGIDLYSDNLD